MMLIITESTLANPGVLETSSLPKKFLGRAVILPRRSGLRAWLRLAVEVQVLRFMVTLLPFAAAPLLFRNLAMPVMEAPALMVMWVAVIELKVLRLSKSARSATVTKDEADRRLDILSFRARACLRQIAARHGIAEGELRLVVEQSELARLAPLTLVSVQTGTPRPHLLVLDEKDRAVLQQGLFDADFTERDLLSINHRDTIYLRDIAQEARAVSAHARLAAFIDKRQAAI
jgi:hypothetical protein